VSATSSLVVAALLLASRRRCAVFTAEEGGAQHCQRDYLTLVVATIGDWLEDKLVRI